MITSKVSSTSKERPTEESGQEKQPPAEASFGEVEAPAGLPRAHRKPRGLQTQTRAGGDAERVVVVVKKQGTVSPKLLRHRQAQPPGGRVRGCRGVQGLRGAEAARAGGRRTVRGVGGSQ